MSNDAPDSVSDSIEFVEIAESETDFEELERLALAYETAATDTIKQKVTLEQLTQQAAAWLIGVSTKHLRDQQAARNRDGTYNGPDLVQWIIDRTLGQAKKQWERDSGDLKTATERQAEARAVKLEEEAKALQGEYVLREEITRDLRLAFGRVRDRLQSLGTEIAVGCPGELKADVKAMVEDRVRVALKELADGTGAV